MVDDARGEDVAIDVGHLVGADDKGVVAFLELIDKGLYGVWGGVGVVGVELDGIASAAWVVDGFVPVASDGVVSGVLCDIDEFRGSGVGFARVLVGFEEFSDDVLCAVCGIVVHDEDVERVGCSYLLGERAGDGISDGSSAVFTGYDDACGNGEVVFFDFYGMDVGGVDEGVDGAEMFGYGLLHLYLHGAVAGVNIVEEFLAGLAVVVLDLIVEVFGDVYEG